MLKKKIFNAIKYNSLIPERSCC